MYKYAYSIQEAAELTGFGNEYLLRKIKAGELQAAGGGHSEPYLITHTELERWWRTRGGGSLGGESPLRTILEEFADRLRDAETEEDLQKLEEQIAFRLGRSGEQSRS